MENIQNAVVVRENYSVTSTPEQIRANVNLIQQVMQKVMHKGTHYDTIAGCGPKPTLLKSGAEKLCSTFLLAPEPIVEDLSTHDERRYRVICKLIHSPSGTFMGSGIGECSSEEEKYKWKRAVCEAEYNATAEDRRRIKYLSSGQQIKQIRTNIADVANTVLKMAKKRALVDGTLTVTGATDMFTQDIEDMDIQPQKTTPTISKSAPLPNEIDLAAKAEEAKKRKAEQEAHEAAQKPAGEVKNEPPANEPKAAPTSAQRVIKGLIEAAYPRKGRGPYSWKVNGEYIKSFDDTIAQTINDYHAANKPIECICEISQSGQYTNLMVFEIVKREENNGIMEDVAF